MIGLGVLFLLWAWMKSREAGGSYEAQAHADVPAMALPMGMPMAHPDAQPLVFSSASPGLPMGHPVVAPPVAPPPRPQIAPPHSKPPGTSKPPAPVTATPASKPPTQADHAAAVLPAPWPAATPPDLPPFPGPGWQYDNPPPLAVQARAKQLLSQLWKTGKGSYVTEQTGGRWISYLAEPLKPSGKHAVTAWRLKASKGLTNS